MNGTKALQQYAMMHNSAPKCDEGKYEVVKCGEVKGDEVRCHEAKCDEAKCDEK